MKTLSSLRVEASTLDKMHLAIQKYNSKNLFQCSEAEFRRMALQMLSEMILQDLPLPIKIR